MIYKFFYKFYLLYKLKKNLYIRIQEIKDYINTNTAIKNKYSKSLDIKNLNIDDLDLYLNKINNISTDLINKIYLLKEYECAYDFLSLIFSYNIIKYDDLKLYFKDYNHDIEIKIVKTLTE